MPKPPDLTAVDQLATNTAKRLDRHINRSGERHRGHGSRLASVEQRLAQVEEELRILQARMNAVRPTQ